MAAETPATDQILREGRPFQETNATKWELLKEEEFMTQKEFAFK